MVARELWFTGPRSVEVRTRTISDPAPDEVRISAHVSAVSSGSESLLYSGNVPTEQSTEASVDDLSEDLSYPTRYGYAVVGHVEAVGAGVDADWLDRRVFAFHPHASHFCTSPEELVVLPETLSDETAVLLANAETAVNLVLDGAPRIGEHAIVFGQGTVGLLTTALLGQHPLSSLHTVDLHESRRQLGLDLGADRTIDPVDLPDADASVYEPPEGADLTYELTGQPAVLDDAIEVTGFDGRVIVGSWYGQKRAALDLGGQFHRSRIDLKSSQVSTIAPELRGRWSSERRLDVALDQLQTLASDLDPLVTDRLSLDSVDEAFDRIDETPGETVQVLLTYDS
jgi:2-desacetyl-2-hydroxyethyl bacteriochlorophyllide A dehydrogenase